ncbi:hypothetical protein HY522_07095 [bacterium]|nr:hypothetical protein [bacterium]
MSAPGDFRHIRPGSTRTFFEALDLAGLPHPSLPYPGYLAEIGDLFLSLLVAGVDHEVVGDETWYCRILGNAPDAVDSPGPEQITKRDGQDDP